MARDMTVTGCGIFWPMVCLPIFPWQAMMKLVLNWSGALLTRVPM